MKWMLNSGMHWISTRNEQCNAGGAASPGEHGNADAGFMYSDTGGSGPPVVFSSTRC